MRKYTINTSFRWCKISQRSHVPCWRIATHCIGCGSLRRVTLRRIVAPSCFSTAMPATTSDSFSVDQGGAVRRRHNRRRHILIVCVVVAVLVIAVIAVAVVLTRPTVKPGLTIHPAELVIFRSYERQNKYTRELDRYEAAYTQRSHQSQRIMDCSNNNPPLTDHACRFQFNWLSDKCTKPQGWGYQVGKPCVLLTPNKMADWIPETYKTLDELPDAMPQSLKDKIALLSLQRNGDLHQMLWVTCEAVGPVDREYMGNIRMSPWPGFPAYYFPYQDAPWYLEPIVALHFDNLNRGVLVALLCRMWAKNLDPQETSATLEILMD